MPWQLRIEYAGAVYHVMARGAAGRYCVECQESGDFCGDAAGDLPGDRREERAELLRENQDTHLIRTPEVKTSLGQPV